MAHDSQSGTIFEKLIFAFIANEFVVIQISVAPAFFLTHFHEQLTMGRQPLSVRLMDFHV